MIWTWWKRVGITLGLLGLAGWIWAAQLEFRYQGALPRNADSATGNTYPLNVHGVVVYQTSSQRNRLDAFQYASFGVFLLSAVMGLVYLRKFGLPPNLPRPWKPGPGWRSRSR